MSIFKVLSDTDRKAFKAWFATQTLSKILVFFGFIAVLLGLSLFLFYSSGWIFTSLYHLKNFGQLTANYIMRAAILFIVILGIGSSTATCANLFFAGNKNYFYLLTLPLDPRILVRWIVAKTIVVNTIMLTIFLLPLGLTYGSIFGQGLTGFLVIKLGLVILSLAVLTNSGGGMAAVFIAKRIKRHKSVMTILGVIVFMAILVATFRLVFPGNLTRLTQIDSRQFFPIYNNLPLNNRFIPTNWLADMLTTTSATNVVLSLVFTAGLFLVYLRMMAGNFYPILLSISAKAAAPQATLSGTIQTNTAFHFEKYSAADALALKDLAAIIRAPGESGYGIFLILLIGFFFYLFSRVSIQAETTREWTNWLVVFAYAGFGFFANTYLLRMVFPLTAKESTGAWYIFSLPISKNKLLGSKMLLAYLVSLPLLLMALLIWWLPPFLNPYQNLLAIGSFITTGMLVAMHTLMGAISPNFADGDSPERVSTSSMGMAALVVTTAFELLSAYGIYSYINHSWSFERVLIMPAAAGGCILLTLVLIFRQTLGKYQF